MYPISSRRSKQQTGFHYNKPISNLKIIFIFLLTRHTFLLENGLFLFLRNRIQYGFDNYSVEVL